MSQSEAILAGDRRALARGLSLVERGGEEAVALLDSVVDRLGKARRVGITGPPGAGKSTLVARIVRLYREAGLTVGVVAVDPTSPFTGGALLGDRHRMTAEAHDKGVFVRSLASRGSLGGLSRAAPACMDLLDAAGFDRIIVETVGVGQSEVEVAGSADSVVVVLSPESGDAVQAMKAGLLEVADILCVNKSDREGADLLAASLDSMLDLREPREGWRPPVVLTCASEAAGPLREALTQHAGWLREGDRLARRRLAGVESRLESLVGRMLAERLVGDAGELLKREAAGVAAGERSVMHAARRAVEEILS
jgi:LAO/AO transport system kinase